MCALCTQELAGLSHAQMTALLPASHEWGRAGAALCLLSNLLEAGGSTLQVKCTGLSSASWRGSPQLSNHWSTSSNVRA